MIILESMDQPGKMMGTIMDQDEVTNDHYALPSIQPFHMTPKVVEDACKNLI
jgi:hypothetical protein